MPFKFCPECGTKVEPGAAFCSSCGAGVGAARPGGGNPLPIAGIVTLVSLLALGGGFWLWLQFAPEPPRPLKPGERAPGVMASAPPAGGGGAAPTGAPHPPLELPADIKAYMANLQSEAEANPDDKQKWTTLGGVYYRASRLDPAYREKAIAAYQHLVDLDENDLDGLRGLGNLAYDGQDRKGAVEYYEKYLTQSPADSEVRTDLGTMYYESGDRERAITEYERVLATSPSFYQAHFNLAVVHDANGDREKSHEALEKARDVATDPNAKQRIGALLEIARSQNLPLTQAASALAAQSAPAGTVTAEAPGAGPGAAPASAPAAAPADTFKGAVEQLFRGHRIAGPKVVSIEWPDDSKARVMMANFPMDQMPEVMKIGYLGKMSDGITAAQERFEVTGPVTVELVDQPTGNVMATVDPSQQPGPE